MAKILYELSNGKTVTRKVRGSGREAMMRAAAKAPQGAVLLAKARTRKEVVGSRVSDEFVRMPTPAGAVGMVCIKSTRTGKVTCVDPSSYRKAQRWDRAVKSGQIVLPPRRPSASAAPRSNPEYMGDFESPMRSNPAYEPARLNPGRRRRRRRPSF